MRRRVFLGFLGCTVTLPIALKAQSVGRVRVVGILNSGLSLRAAMSSIIR
jgi:hypothetical protein